MRYIFLLFFTFIFAQGFGQPTKDGIHYFPAKPLEFDGIKIYFGPSYGPERKTFTTILFENNNPEKIIYHRIDTLQFIYPDGKSVSKKKGTRRYKEVHFGKTLKRGLGVSEKGFNHFYERVSMNFQGIKIGTKQEWKNPIKPILLKNLNDTTLVYNDLKIKVRKNKSKNGKIYMYSYLYVNSDLSEYKNFIFDRQKIVFRNEKGEKLKGPKFDFRQATIDSKRLERIYFSHNFKSENVYIDFSEALAPVEIEPITLPQFHFFAQAPFGHEVTCQDKIELKDGTVIIATVARLTDELVAFRKCVDGPLSESYDFTEIPRSDLKKITYSNGSIDDFATNNENIDQKYIKTMIEIHKLPQ